MKKKRCVFNKAEVVEVPQPQPVEIKKEIKKEIEKKEKIKELVEEEPKKEEKAEIKKEEKINEENNIRKPRKGMNLYTINSNIKVGDLRYNITKVIEEKNEKMANILFDKTVKKELGKIKSSTKRTIRPYENGDEDKCEEIIEIKEIKEETDPKLIELNKKLEILEKAEKLFIFKVELSKAIVGDNVMYFYQRDIDGVYREIKTLIEVNMDFGNNSDLVDRAYKDICSHIKKIVALSVSEIRTNKECLKKLADTTIEELESMAKKSEIVDDLIIKLVETRLKFLTELGFNLYEVKIPDMEMTFVECAKTDEEMASLVSVEPDVLDYIRENKGRLSFESHKIQDIENIDILTLKEIVQEDDHLYNLINSTSKGIEKQYVEYYTTTLNMARKKGFITEKNGKPTGNALSSDNLPASNKNIKEMVDEFSKIITNEDGNRKMRLPLNTVKEDFSVPLTSQLGLGTKMAMLEKSLSKEATKAQTRFFQATGKKK